MLTDNKQIAIIGGGPGGLTLARLLQLKGANVHVYERDTDRSVRQQGATLDLHEESGLRAITEAGLLSEFRKHYRPGADLLRVTDEHAVIHYDEHQEQYGKDFGEAHFRPEIDRGPLRDILIGSLLPGTVVWNSQFTTMERTGAGWTIHFKNGAAVYADLVVAADGANSRVRPYITDIASNYSGMTVIEGNIYNAAHNAPQLHALTKGGKVFALGNDKSIILSAKGDGSLSFYTGTWEDEQWLRDCGIDFNDKEQVYSWFRTRFADWGMQWHELFATDKSYFIPRPMYHYTGLQQWPVSGNITMLGDAAHRMPPYAGEGVNMAMLDALELSHHLTLSEHADMQSSIAAFEQDMCTRAAEVTAFTLQQMQALHSAGAVAYLLSLFNGDMP